jgi:phage terminase small subunit
MFSATLTIKQTRWVGHYLATGNATASAVEAGFSVK